MIANIKVGMSGNSPDTIWRSLEIISVIVEAQKSLKSEQNLSFEQLIIELEKPDVSSIQNCLLSIVSKLPNSESEMTKE